MGMGRLILNPEPLDFGYVPPEMPHRESHFKKAYSVFSQMLSGSISQSAFFYGPVGTGKTCMAKFLCSRLMKEAEGRAAFDYRVVNCRERRSLQKVVYELANHYQRNLKERGFSVSEMIDIFRRDLQSRRTRFLVVLDEVDVLLKREGSDAVYMFTRFSDEVVSPQYSLSLILISTQNVLTMMDSASRSSFKGHNIINFGRYSAEELYSIVSQRVKMALAPGVMGQREMTEVAEIAAETGDARKAIELVQASAVMAEAEGEDRITVEYIRAAKAEVDKVFVEQYITELDSQQLAVLLAAARQLRKKETVFMGELERAYHIVCEEAGLEKRKHTQVWKYVKELDALGILEAKQSGKGVHGTTTVVSLKELPAVVVVEYAERYLGL